MRSGTAAPKSERTATIQAYGIEWLSTGVKGRGQPARPELAPATPDLRLEAQISNAASPRANRNLDSARPGANSVAMPPMHTAADADQFSLYDRLAEVWRFREVIKNFVSQDLKVKYRRSALRFFWSLLNPLLQLAVLSVVFSLMFRMNNLTLYILSGIIPWTFFATTVDGCSMSIVSAESMLRRQYFPKLVFPLSVALQNLVTFVLSLFVLLLALGWAIGFRPTPALLVLPISFACIVAFGLGLGLLATVVTVYF